MPRFKIRSPSLEWEVQGSGVPKTPWGNEGNTREYWGFQKLEASCWEVTAVSLARSVWALLWGLAFSC